MKKYRVFYKKINKKKKMTKFTLYLTTENLVFEKDKINSEAFFFEYYGRQNFIGQLSRGTIKVIFALLNIDQDNS